MMEPQLEQVALFSMINWPCFRLSRCNQDGPSGPLFGDQLALFSVDKNKCGPIDVEKAREIIEYAYEHGVNYFDTAYGYHGGESERFVGRVLSQYPRASWHLATKIPGHMLHFRNGRLEFSG